MAEGDAREEGGHDGRSRLRTSDGADSRSATPRGLWRDEGEDEGRREASPEKRFVIKNGCRRVGASTGGLA